MDKETKKCPFCGEEILATAKKCKHCKQFLEEDKNQVKSETAKTIQAQSSNHASKKGIISVVLGIIIFGIISNSSSNSFLKGCELENERDINSRYGPVGITKTYYCKNNNLYDEVDIDYRNGNNYPDYSFLANKNIFARYYRKNGEYYCSVYNIKDDEASCNENKMIKLIKANTDKINDEVKSDRAKEKIESKTSGFLEASLDLERKSYAKCLYNNECSQNLNCKDLINVMQQGNPFAIKSVNSCQVQYNDGVIMAISEDSQYATIYDSEDPMYYANIKYNHNGDSSWIEYTGSRIPADIYIKSDGKAKQLSEKEIRNVNPRLHTYS